MKAVAVSPSSRQVGLVDVAEPALQGNTQVRIRILEVGVCGTDKEICRFDYGTPPSGSEYLVLGHEALGIVEDAGADVKRVKQGDLVAAVGRAPCLLHARRIDAGAASDFSRHRVPGRGEVVERQPVAGDGEPGPRSERGVGVSCQRVTTDRRLGGRAGTGHRGWDCRAPESERGGENSCVQCATNRHDY